MTNQVDQHNAAWGRAEQDRLNEEATREVRSPNKHVYSNFTAVCESFVHNPSKKVRNATRSLFGKGDGILYSYGHHFPLAYAVPSVDTDRGLHCGVVFIMNGDKYSHTTSQQQGEFLRACRSAGMKCLTTSRSAWPFDLFYAIKQGAAVIAAANNDEYRYGHDGSNYSFAEACIHYPESQGWTVKPSKYCTWTAHKPGGLLIEVIDATKLGTVNNRMSGLVYDRETQKHSARVNVKALNPDDASLPVHDVEISEGLYLCGTDEGSYFVSKLPPVKQDFPTILDAYNALMPDAVKSYKDSFGPEIIKRQGEWFFVESKWSTRLLAPWSSGHACPITDKHGKKAEMLERTAAMPAKYPVGDPHTATEVRVNADGQVYVRGTIRHSGGGHAMLKLGKTWHAVYHNTALISWSSDYKVD